MANGPPPQRESNGRFRKGWSGGPGRPPKETERRYLEAFAAGCPPKKLVEVVGRLVDLALAGDVPAARLLLQHALPLSTRIHLLAETPIDAYRVAGLAPSETNRRMLRRLVEAIKQNRERDAASGDWPPPSDK